MMNTLKRLSAVFLLAFAVSGCLGNNGPNQMAGTFIGAGLGGFAGSHIGKGNGNLAAVAIGTLGGAVIGSEIGRGMDQQQRQYHYPYPPSQNHGSVYMVPAPQYGYAGCDRLGPTSQARADCVRGIADANARRDEHETNIRTYHRW